MPNSSFLLFEVSAIEAIVKEQEYQSYEFLLAKTFISSICTGEEYQNGTIYSVKKNDGLLFLSHNPSPENQFLVFDLTKCELINIEESTPENILIVLQKVFRSAIRFWRNQPFTSAERINHTKLVVFPFKYNMNGRQNKRLVLERKPSKNMISCEGINRPLLAYKYNDEDVANGADEVADIDILELACGCFVEVLQTMQEVQSKTEKDTLASIPLGKKSLTNLTSASSSDMNEGFKYMQFNQKLEQLTEYQKAVVLCEDIETPIRVDGPAGTGKSMSLILRAYRLLCIAAKDDVPFRVIFFAHSTSTRHEIEEAFKLNKGAERFLSDANSSKQTIEIITLLDWCKNFIGFQDAQMTDLDASTAKDYQRLLIHELYEDYYNKNYSTYEPHLSDNLKKLVTPENILFSSLDYMLQHEFSIQIKGRANGDLELYKKIPSIKYGLPVMTEKDKEFVFGIFREYQSQLDDLNQYDTDDVVIETISRLNAPFWRRERARTGYDYIFADEMHLFNSNEQYAFHYLTRSLVQAKIPICFALDYSQAIGDRGDVLGDYIETDIASKAIRQTYQTVFRSSQEITDFCASIVASGTQLFKSDFNNPYDTVVSGLGEKEQRYCKVPQMHMYDNDDEMLKSIKKHINNVKREFGSDCKNYEIAVISFDSEFLNREIITQKVDRNFFYLKSRNAEGLSGEVKSKNQYILASPDNINGLEFKCVIIVGVDDGRVPPKSGTSDISENYLRYTAINQLYLCCSRAKYRLILLGNKLHGESPCLQYPLELGTLICETPAK